MFLIPVWWQHGHDARANLHFMTYLASVGYIRCTTHHILNGGTSTSIQPPTGTILSQQILTSFDLIAHLDSLLLF